MGKESVSVKSQSIKCNHVCSKNDCPTENWLPILLSSFSFFLICRWSFANLANSSYELDKGWLKYLSRLSDVFMRTI